MKPEEERDRLLACLILCIERLGGRVVMTHDDLNDANEHMALQVVDDSQGVLVLKAVAIPGSRERVRRH
jgi:hypothetical protein